MITEELYIEGKLVDLTPNTVTINLQLNDLGKITNKKSSFTQTINLPKTANNTMIFEMLGTMGNNSTAPYRKLSCRYVVNSIPLISDGYAVVDATGDTYKLNIYDGVIDLGAAIQGLDISDLDLSGYNHFLNQISYEGFNKLNNFNTVIYAPAQFTNEEEPNYTKIKVNQQFPLIRVKEIFERIFLEAGFDMVLQSTLQGFEDEVVCLGKGYEIEDITPVETDIGKEDKQTYTVSTGYAEPTSGILIPNNISYTIDTNYFTNLGDRFECVQSGVFKFKVYNELIQNFGTSSIRLYKDDVPVSTFEPNSTGYFYLQVDAGDVISLRLEWDTEEYIDSTDNQIQFTFYSAIRVFHVPITTNLIDLTNVGNKDKQLDFVKDILIRYGLLVKKNSKSGKMEIKSFKDLINSRSTARDYSSKLISIEEESYNIDYSQRNNFSYKYPDNDVLRAYDGYFEVNNGIIGKEDTVYESKYKIPEYLQEFLSEPLYKIPLLELDENGDVANISDNVPTNFFKIKRQNKGFPTQIGVANFSVPDGNNAWLTLDNTEMQYYLDNFYSEIITTLQRYKEVEATMSFTLMDIYNFDFFKLIYLKQTGKYYYINKVRYNPNRTETKVSLVELNY